MNADYLVMEIDMMNTEIEENFNEDASLYSLIESTKAMIDKLIIKMKSYVKKLQSDIKILSDKHTCKIQLKKLEEELKNPKNKHKTYKFPNMSEAIDVYRGGIGKLTKKLDKILKKDYKEYNSNDKKNIDSLIADFEYDVDDLDEQIDAALSDTISLHGQEALDYVKELRTGQNIIYKYYFDVIHKYEKFKIDAEAQLKMKEKDSSITFQIINKKTSLLSKLSAKLSKMVRKIIVQTAAFFA